MRHAMLLSALFVFSLAGCGTDSSSGAGGSGGMAAAGGASGSGGTAAAGGVGGLGGIGGMGGDAGGSGGDGGTGGTFSVTPQLVAGDRHVCFLFEDGRAKCWGELAGTILSRLGNEPDEMGANLPFLDFGPDARITQIDLGQASACAIFESRELKCWGANQFGQLGSESNAQLDPSPDLPAVDLGTDRYAVDVSIGWRHTCAVLDDGSVKCWGENVAGKLGYGDIVARGNAPDTMGDDLPTVDLGTGRTAVQVSVHAFHSCALLDDGSMKCWGEGANGSPGGVSTGGQLGQESFLDIGDAPDEMGDDLPPIDLGTNRTATSISTGAGLSCAVLDNESLKCFGRNDFGGRVGAGDNDPHGSAPGTMGDALLPVNLGTNRTALQVTCGRRHSCALLDGGDVKCWGSRDILGREEGSGTIGDSASEMGDNLPAVDLGTGRTAVAVTTFEAHTCAILDNAAVKCWGTNNTGQLGLGDTDTRGDEVDEMGDDLPDVELE